MKPFSEEPYFHGCLGILSCQLGGLTAAVEEDEDSMTSPFDFIALHGKVHLNGIKK